jgi:uncharacterized membrane protein YfcA
VELELLGLAALGLAVGAYGTVIGLGGGFILVPALLFLYPEYEPEQFTAVSLAVVWANTASGTAAYARQRRVDYLTGLIFAASSAPGVVAGALAVHLVPERLFVIVFALILLALGVLTLRGRRQAIRTPLRGWGVLRRSFEGEWGTYRWSYRVWQGALISLGVGFLSSLLGIGGGAVHVPAMIMVLHFPVEIAVATSQFVLMFMTGGATVVHLATQTLGGDQLTRAAALAAGAVPGAQLGALIARRLRPRVTMWLLGIALIGLAARLLLRGLAGA